VNRRAFTALGLGTAIGLPLGAVELARAVHESEAARLPDRPLPVPPGGIIRTAVAIGPGANVIDLAGPWEVFQDAAVNHGAARFELFTVAESTQPVSASGGLTITPTYSYEESPRPHVVVVPAHGTTDGTLSWLRRVDRQADLVMSVCTGAYVLGQAGLLDGKTATTHHQSYDDFQATFPKVRLVRGRRFVEHEHLATAGGLTSGIDLALRVVERYLGRDAVARTAAFMEYQRRR
jgi:transcriptional regulator GlxA family with amidase domain